MGGYPARGRPRWASMTEQEIDGNSMDFTASMVASFSPPKTDAMAIGSGAYDNQGSMGHTGSTRRGRQRWASMTDDELFMYSAASMSRRDSYPGPSVGNLYLPQGPGKGMHPGHSPWQHPGVSNAPPSGPPTDWGTGRGLRRRSSSANQYFGDANQHGRSFIPPPPQMPPDMGMFMPSSLPHQGYPPQGHHHPSHPPMPVHQGMGGMHGPGPCWGPPPQFMGGVAGHPAPPPAPWGPMPHPGQVVWYSDPSVVPPSGPTNWPPMPPPISGGYGGGCQYDRYGPGQASYGGAYEKGNNAPSGEGRDGGHDRQGRTLNGWTVIWVGERAFRAPTSMKEQIESYGFLVRIYRRHDKCIKALEKKSSIAQSHLFVVSDADAEPILNFMQSRGEWGVHLIVDAESSTNLAAAHELAFKPSCPKLSTIVVTFSWDEALSEIHDIGITTAKTNQSTKNQEGSSPGSPVQNTAKSEDTPKNEKASEASWTLVWVSDQAFKPAAAPQKKKLEAMGCQVKGYKAHKNAIRALDKKRALVRTIVLVSGYEASALMQYFVSRPELTSTPVVVEGACSRSPTIREGPTCRIAENFDAAITIVWDVAKELEFNANLT